MRKFLSVLLLCLPLWACAEEATEEHSADAGDYAAGIDFTVLMPPLTGAAEGKVKVVEMFWYGCPHCFQFEPYMHKWMEKMPANVEFERIPAIFNNPTWELHARAYYTAEVMGVLDKVHEAMFEEIHVRKKPLKTRESVRAFFVSRGVDGGEFDATFNSFAVNGMVREAALLTDQYQVSGVPMMAVQGKYKVGGKMAGSYANMIRIVNALIAKETAAK